MKKEHLLHFFPFLKKEFRKIEKKEIKSEDTFKEFFGDTQICTYKLKAIYEYQQAGGKVKQEIKQEIKQEETKKKNGKV